MQANKFNFGGGPDRPLCQEHRRSKRRRHLLIAFLMVSLREGVMRGWFALALCAALGACISVTETSPVTTKCCLINAGADAGGEPSCWCGNASSASGSSISTVVTGSTCKVTFTETVDGGSTVQIVQGSPPASSEACGNALPGA
jgi:hypothetical protein